MILNQEVLFNQVNHDVQDAFTGGVARKVLFVSGYEFYKFTQYPLSRHGEVTPWWSSVKPTGPKDTGLDILLERSERMAVNPTTFARARNAVTNQWNSMTGLLIAKLRVPVYGFVGYVRHQKMDEGISNVVFIGGAVQVWIPNLTTAHIARK